MAAGNMVRKINCWIQSTTCAQMPRNLSRSVSIHLRNILETEGLSDISSRRTCREGSLAENSQSRHEEGEETDTMPARDTC